MNLDPKKVSDLDKSVLMQNAKLCAKHAVLRIRDPKFSAFFGKKLGSQIRYKHIGSYFRQLSNIFWIKNT
jgi:hypothetical protein